MPANDDLQDAQVRHQMFLQRHSAQVVAKAVALLNQSIAGIVARLEREDMTGITEARLRALLKAEGALVKEAYKPVRDAIRKDVEAFARYEAQFQAGILAGPLPVQLDVVTPAPAQVVAAVKARPFQGRHLREWFKDMEEGAFARLRNAIRIGYVEGRTTEQVVRDIRGTRRAKYADGIMQASRRSVQATVRTAMTHTANVARHETYMANEDLIEGVLYVATLDSRTTLVCASNDGKVFPVDSGPRPPLHPNCLTGDSKITASPRVSGYSVRMFDGEIVDIETSGGRRLSCTPNHPILSPEGWVLAGSLDFGDEIVCYERQDVSLGPDDLDENPVPLISEIAKALFASGSMSSSEVPVSAPDFHGDGSGSEVAVVGSYRSLDAEFESGFLESFSQESLVNRNLLASGSSSFAKLLERGLASFGGLVGVGDELLDFFRGRPVHPGLLLLGPVSWLASEFGQDFSHRVWRDSELFPDRGDAYAAVEHVDDSFLIDTSDGSFMLGHDLDVSSDKLPVDDASPYSDICSRLIDRRSGQVEIDRVVKAVKRDFSGHVYNLETSEGYYIAEGIVTHNCRSTTTPVLKSWKELGIDLEEAPEGTRASLNGQVPASLTYSDFLRKQPVAFQDEFLGRTAGRLFRRGKLPLDRFVDRRGNQLSLDQLRQREPAAWKRAGL